MSTIRVAKRNRFTTVDRETVNDDRLSFRARGILLWLLDKPDDWTTSAEALANEASEGRDAIRTALRELETLGYIVRMKRQDDNGQWSTTRFIYERPAEDGFPVVGHPKAGNPKAGNPSSGDPAPGESGPLLNTEDQKTETELTPLPPSSWGEIEIMFAAFWNEYPRKIGKPAAQRAFKKAVKKAGHGAIGEGLARWVEFWGASETEEGFIPHPSTWLNQERWNDPTPGRTPGKRSAMDVLRDAERRHA